MLAALLPTPEVLRHVVATLDGQFGLVASLLPQTHGGPQQVHVVSQDGGARTIDTYWLKESTDCHEILREIAYHLLIRGAPTGGERIPVVVVDAFTDALRWCFAFDGRKLMRRGAGYEWVVVSRDGELVGFIEGREVGDLPRPG